MSRGTWYFIGWAMLAVCGLMAYVFGWSAVNHPFGWGVTVALWSLAAFFGFMAVDFGLRMLGGYNPVPRRLRAPS